MSFRPPVLYPITDPIVGAAAHPELVRRLLAGGARIVQVRDKHLPDDALLDELDAAVLLARQAGALLLVNDRPDLARLAGAGGVHLGEEDLPLAAARALLGPTAVLGSSSHDAPSAWEAERQGADYVAIGPIFPTASKADAGEAVGLERLREVRAAVRIPVVAIGGITLGRAPEVLSAGADSVAIVRDLLAADDVALRVAGWMRSRPSPPRGLAFLTGFMGSGKTTVGREVARRLGRRFVDLDAEVEAREGRTVEEIFRGPGEAAFRAAEAALISGIPTGADAVVALGGGTLLAPGVADRVRSLGMLLWLDASLAESRARCAAGGGRPLWRDGELEALRERRLPGYRRANRRVEVDGREVGAIAEEIAAFLAGSDAG